MNRVPVEGIDGEADQEKITGVLNKYGIQKQGDTVQIEIWGSGKPMREFLWSEDMADACVFLMENRDFKDCYDPTSKEIRNTHINIGAGVDLFIKELAETIKKTLGFKGGLYFNTDKPEGAPKKLTDVSKLHGLGWRHTVELEDGIGKIYNWYRNRN